MNLDWQKDLYCAFREGYQAHQKNQAAQNPYTDQWPGRYYFSLWNDGFFQARKDDRKRKKRRAKLYLICICFLWFLGMFSGGCIQPIKITEVMFNPSAALDKYGEYIEFCNTGVYPIDLTGYFLDEASRIEVAWLTSSYIFPNECHTIGRSNDPEKNGGLVHQHEPFQFFLDNDFDSFYIADDQSIILDRLDYFVGINGWPDCSEGASIIRKSAQGQTSNPENWRCPISGENLPDGDRGTPGQL